MAHRKVLSADQCADLEESFLTSPGRAARTSRSSSCVRSKRASSTSQLERRSGSYPVVRLAPGPAKSKRAYALGNVPNEVLSLVFSFLDIRSLFMSQTVNKTWREALWAAQTHLSFALYHTRPIPTQTSHLLHQDFTRYSDCMEHIVSPASIDPGEGNWLVNSKMVSAISSRAKKLLSFDLSDCLGLSSLAFASLLQLSILQDLSLARTPLTNQDCSFLSGLTHLKSLNLLGCCIGDDGVAHLASLSSLEHLKIGGPWYHSNGAARLPSAVLTESSWNIIGRLSSLVSLVVKCVPMSSKSHESLGTLVNLQTLSISLGEDSPDLSPLMMTPVGVSLEAPLDLLFLASMERLTFLRLDTLKRLTAEGAAMVGSRRNLVALSLPQCFYTQAVYPYLRHLSALTYLACLRCHLSATQIAESYPLLQQLEMPDGFVSEEPLFEDSTNESTTTGPYSPSNPHGLGAATTTTTTSPTNTITIWITHITTPGGAFQDTAASPNSTTFFHHRDDANKHTPRSSAQFSDLGSPQSPMYHIPSLTHLEVDYTSTIDLISSVFSCAPALRQLHLFDDQEDGPPFDQDLELPSDKDILHGKLCLPALPHLRSLVSYSAAQRLDWASVMLDAFSAAPNLVHLRLSTGSSGGGLFPTVFDRALRALASLESLELRNFRHVASLSCLSSLHGLKSLNIVGLESAHLETLESASGGGGRSTIFQDIAASRSIEKLGITYSHKITDADLRVIVKKMTQLQEIDLSSLDRISDRTLKRLSKPGKGLRNLAVIRLKYCPLLTPSGLLALSNLKHLYHIETSVQSRYLYAEDHSQIDLLFSKFSSIFVSTS